MTILIITISMNEEKLMIMNKELIILKHQGEKIGLESY